jgi:hypothetical protein
MKMKKILIFLVIFFMFSAVNVYAQSMSKYGYPSNYHPSKKITTSSNSGYPVSQKQNNNQNYSNINPAILSVNNMLSISFSDLGLNYGEYNDGSVASINNKYLDTNNGSIKGFNISGSNTYYNWYTNVNFSYYTGNDTYSGHNQVYSGTLQNPQMLYPPLAETSSSKIYNFNLKFGYMFPITNKFVITPYGDLGWHIWDRGDNTSQYAHYSNWLAMVGILAQYAITPKLVGDVDFSYGTTFDAKAQENHNASGGAYYCQNTVSSCNPFLIGEDTINFNLGSKAIYNLSAGLDYRFNNNFHIFGNVNYERFEYGQSSTVYLTPTNIYNNGVLVNKLPNNYTEPNSVTNEIIYSIGIGYSF